LKPTIDKKMKDIETKSDKNFGHMRDFIDQSLLATNKYFTENQDKMK